MSLRTTTQASPAFSAAGCKSVEFNGVMASFARPVANPSVTRVSVRPTSINVNSTEPVQTASAIAARSVICQANESPLQAGRRNSGSVAGTPDTETPGAAASSSTSKPPVNELEPSATCVVCGEDGAKTHYNVLACLGCKGFFRRALKKADQYECINDNKCVINKYGRNSCRACRLRKCLDAGMDPSAVRPDRDFIGKQNVIRLPQIKKNWSMTEMSWEQQGNKDVPGASSRSVSVGPSEDWSKKLPVEMRTMLMNLLNIEVKISRGDTLKEPSEVYPLGITIREVIENPEKLKGRRTEMRYEPYRMARNQELSMIVYRRVIAAIDWVEFLAEMVDGLSVDDKIALVKSCYAPLLLFKCSARTAMVTEKEDILCLCNFAYVPHNIAKAYSDTYHLDNTLVDRLITELVKPFRRIKISEEEVVCLSAIIVLNPMAKDLSQSAVQKVSALRDKIQETLFQYIKEARPGIRATCQFGNFLLYIPIITSLSNALCENLRFAQTFSMLGSFPLLTSVFGCFPVEPLDDLAQLSTDFGATAGEVICKNAEVQTEASSSSNGRGIKRRLPSYFVSPVENESSTEHREFRLLRPPCSYTLTEMFEDRMNDEGSQADAVMNPQFTWPCSQKRMGGVAAGPSQLDVRQQRSYTVSQMHVAAPSSTKQTIKPSLSVPSAQLNECCATGGEQFVQGPSALERSQSFYFTVTPVAQQQQFSPSPTPAIEKLTFEHRERD